MRGAPLHIQSMDNPQFKQLKRLARSSRERRKQNQTLLDGVHLIQAWLNSGRPLQRVMVRADAMPQHEIEMCLQAIVDTPQLILDKALFDALSPVEHPTGILALVDIPSPQANTKQFAVMLENIQDPGNLGGVLRTAAAAGVDNVYLSKGCAEAWSPKALRAGMGAQFVLAIHEQQDLLRMAGEWEQVIATRLNGEHSLYDVAFQDKVAFLFGNEGAGLSEALVACATQKIHIPMPGPIESLNVGAAAAVCLFERMRRLQT